MARSISYQDAMQTLTTMFDTVDKDVIHMVLQNNGGHMERTVECLLQMQGDKTIQTPGADQPAAARPAGPAPTTKGGRTPVQLGRPLPDDFLRPPSHFKRDKSISQRQIEQDAQLAALLQNEAFLQDVRRNPHMYMRQPRGQRQHRQPQQQQPAPVPAAAAAQPAVPVSPRSAPATQAPAPAAAGVAGAPPVSPRGAVHEEYVAASEHPNPTFREKFARLGDAAKRKLSSLAGRFSGKQGEQKSYMSLPSLDEDSNAIEMEVQGNNPSRNFTIDDEDDAPSLEDPRKKKEVGDGKVEDM